MNQVSFRKATEEDIHLIFQFIVDLAKYEDMESSVIVTEEVLKHWLFEEKKAEVTFILKENKEVGFALYYYIFSSFSGKAGLFIEDLFVKPTYRKKGYGKALFQQVACIAKERGCEKLDWLCLDWNKPSIDFYESLGAKCLSEWNKFQLVGDAFQKLTK